MPLQEYSLLELSQSHRKIEKYLSILLTIAFIASFLIAFLLPYFICSKEYLTYSEYLSRVYDGINRPKTITLIVLNCIVYALGLFTLYKTYNNTRFNTRTRIFLLVIWFLFMFGWLLTFVLFMPQHAAWGLYSYGVVQAPKQPEQYIHFLGLGDIQEFGNGANNRYEKSKTSVQNVRRIIEHFEHPDALQGLITVGDCTQTGEDGRSFNPNYLADYEARFGLGTHGSVPIQVYECTGNHDWDCTEEIYPRMKLNYAKFENPTVKMIKRRNKFRHGITATDEYGNYEWQWKTKQGKYNFIGIALNIGVTNDKLLSGQPVNSINFLKQRIQVHNSPNDRFFILTHWYDDKNDYKFILECFGDKFNQLKAIFIGHLHVSNLGRLLVRSDLMDKVLILPSPIEGDNVALFSYDTINDKLLYFNFLTNEQIQKFNPNVSSIPSRSVRISKGAQALNQNQMNHILDINPKQLIERDGSLYLS